MKNKGVTLVELVVVIVISGFIVLAMTCQWVAYVKNSSLISDQFDATTDASLAMHSMERVLRWAVSSATPSINTDANYVTSITVTINKTDSLPEILSSPTTVIFGLKANNSFECKVGAAIYVIANDITSFPISGASWDSVNKELTLQITATKNTRSCSLESKVHLVGGLWN